MSGTPPPPDGEDTAARQRLLGRQEELLRREVVDTCQRMTRDGLVVGTSGNVSARVGAHVLVTPSGVDYRQLHPEQLPLVDLEGRHVSGELRPTSELPLHLTAYRTHPDARGVVHTHAAHATAVSTLVATVPNVHYMLATAGGPVRVAPYATYGTDELAAAAADALHERTMCLLRNHGTLAVGRSLDEAYDRSAQLEWACRVWLLARSAGQPSLLPDEELATVSTKLGGYGQPTPAATATPVADAAESSTNTPGSTP